MKKQYSKEEKAAYFKGLRDRWNEIKKAVTEKELDEIKAIILEHGLNVSPYSYAFTASQMRARGLDGIPYLDCKTFMGWKDRGFQVRKGEKSEISGIVWIGPDADGSEPKEERAQGELKFKADKRPPVFPRNYHLFHRSQVEAERPKRSGFFRAVLA